jgi:outer membrane protein
MLKPLSFGCRVLIAYTVSATSCLNMAGAVWAQSADSQPQSPQAAPGGQSTTGDNGVKLRPRIPRPQSGDSTSNSSGSNNSSSSSRAGGRINASPEPSSIPAPSTTTQTTTTSTTTAAPAAGANSGSPIKLQDLTIQSPPKAGGPTPSDQDFAFTGLDLPHEQNNKLGLDQLRLHAAVKGDSFKPIRLEVQYDESIDLSSALKYAIDNNLAIKISRESMNYQRWVMYSQYAGLLPSFTIAYNLTHTDIVNTKTDSLAKVFLERVTYPVFQGGSVVYGIMGQHFREKGWREAYKASISDELLDLYTKYYTLLLDRALLQIRAKAVEVSEEQLRINKAMEVQGTGTRYQVAQADAQLSSDRQALLQAQVTVRQAALALNFSMNYPMGVNLVPVEESVNEEPLFESNASIDSLVSYALLNRPELREYEDFQFAAARNIPVAAAPLYPQVSLFSQYSYSGTNVTQHDTTASSSASTSGAGVFGGLFRTYQQGLAMTWTFSNLGLTSVANIFAADSLARQSRIQSNQELQTVIQQVRGDYLNWRAARDQIDNAAHGVRAASEELRLAKLRLENQVTTNLEVIQAQRDYINALTTLAQAIVSSNIAQAQLLHDTGLISSQTLLHGFKGNLP